MARERPEDGIASWSLVSCSAREMSVRKDETMQNLYERVLSLRVRVRYGAYITCSTAVVDAALMMPSRLEIDTVM